MIEVKNTLTVYKEHDSVDGYKSLRVYSDLYSDFVILRIMALPNGVRGVESCACEVRVKASDLMAAIKNATNTGSP